jgi:biopolymer transport protein ExbD
MAEIEQNITRKHRGVSARKTLSTRVDLTPMVDLGFLLITFFIFTTSIAQPVAMNLAMPDDRSVKDPMLASAEKTLTLVVGGADAIFYYEGIFDGSVKRTSYKSTGIRNIISNKKQRVKDRYKTSGLVVLIKVTKEASYKNIVDCLDEMLINEVSTYMLLDASVDEEKAMLFP